MTARTLETIIRIATASCKIGMRFAINEEDVAVARSILDHCLRNNVGEVCGHNASLLEKPSRRGLWLQ